MSTVQQVDTSVELRVASVKGMPLEHLLRSYRSILRHRAIFYPVAYQFLGELGRGRQGVVMLGLRQGARGCITEHAIKVFDPSIYASPEEYWTDMGRIAAQITRLQHVQSPHLVSRHSYEETHGIGYLEMEVIDGVDLRRLLSRAHLEVVRQRSTAKEWAKFTRAIFRLEGDRLSLQPGVAVYILRGVLQGLESLHAASFLHCDIKPANIMIDRLGYVKLVDFGRGVIEDEQVTHLFGSPYYMAPEIHQRQPGRKQADLYSVGLVALELLCGGPFVGAAEQPAESTLLQLKQALPGRLPELLPPHVLANVNLVNILRKCVDPVPDNRYRSARDAEVGEDGLRIIDKQLVRAGLDSEYARDLADYLAKTVNPQTNRIEFPEPAN